MIAAVPTDALSSATPSLIWLGAALLVGLILWAAGGWLLRSAVGALGFGLGALAGLFAWLETGIGPPWGAPLLGAVVMACVSLLAYRLLAGALLAAAMCLLCTSTGWAVLNLTEASIAAPPVAGMFGLRQPEQVQPTIVPVARQIPSSLPVPTWPDDARLQPIESAWQTLPADARLTVLAAGGAGAVIGLVTSTLFSGFAAVLLTATAGSGVLLGAGARLLEAVEQSPSWLGADVAESGLVLAWVGLAGLGLAVQGLTRPKADAAKKSS